MNSCLSFVKVCLGSLGSVLAQYGHTKRGMNNVMKVWENLGGLQGKAWQ